MTFYKNKYRVEPARLTGYDYSSPGWYFITICTKNRVQYFGEIITVETPDPGVSLSQTAKIQLSEIGQIADKYWNEIPVHFPHVNLDAFQIMPDHIHGIIQITAAETPESGVPTHPAIGIMINLFKRACTIETRNAQLKFAWQTRFHDHIIRDDDELQRIRDYIRNNPKNWVNNKL
jgi:REP element-mobilizing transposase RayT